MGMMLNMYMILRIICHALQLMMKTQVLIWNQRQVDAQCSIRVIPDGKLMRQSEKDFVQTPTKNIILCLPGEK